MLEVCIDSLESARNAIIGGADEIEICSALHAGGLTPTKGLVTEIIDLVTKLPVPHRPQLNVMIRCNEDDAFMYTEQDMDVMLHDLKLFKEMGIDKFVFGTLTDDQDIDEMKVKRILMTASPNKITFSRAFDYVRDTKKAASVLAGLGIYRVLTAGQRKTVDHVDAMPIIATLATRYISGDELIIMPGGGVNIHNVGTFIKMGCSIVHSSCRDTKLGRDRYLTDGNIVRDMKHAIAVALQETQAERK